MIFTSLEMYSLFLYIPAGIIPIFAISIAPSNIGTSFEFISILTFDALAISKAWPSKPNPVISVTEFTFI